MQFLEDIEWSKVSLFLLAYCILQKKNFQTGHIVQKTLMDNRNSDYKYASEDWSKGSHSLK